MAPAMGGGGRWRVVDCAGTTMATRCYATWRPRVAVSRTTGAASLRAASKTARGGGSAGKKVPITKPAPLRKPVTTGLGVASKSPTSTPPAQSTPPFATSGTKRPPLQDTHTTTSTAATAPEDHASAVAAAAAREAKLRIARLRREDRERKEAEEKESKEKYKDKYKGMARRWVAGIIATPVLLVTSYYLFDRCKFCFAFSPSMALLIPQGALGTSL